MWTFVIDMKIEICSISSCRYSSSRTTSVTTTRPSHGAKTSSASWMRTRRGSRKKATTKNQKQHRNSVAAQISRLSSRLVSRR